MKRIFKIALVLLLFSLMAKAQQLPLYSQYMMNRYIINPAVAGTEDYFLVASNNRYQWVGITDAPRTHILSVQGPHRTKNIGFGGSIFSDVTGPTSRTGAYFSYAHHFKVDKKSMVSLGLSGGLLQFKVDGTEITLRDPGDLTITNSVQSVLMPDFGFGAYWYSEKTYAGISVPQFIQNRIEFFQSSTQTLSRLSSHIFINAGHKFKLNYDLELEPSVLLKWGYPAIPQLDFGVKFIYQDFIWGGLAFRTQDAVSLMVGYKTKNDKLLFGYSYDYAITSINKYSMGTHEIMVAAKFNNLKSARRYGKNTSQKHYAENEINENETITKSQHEKRNQLNELAKKDTELRNKVRALREQAETLGQDPNDEHFDGHNEYVAALKAIKETYQQKINLENAQ